MTYPGVAVGVIVVNEPLVDEYLRPEEYMKDVKVLLSRRKGSLGTGQYSVPGGKVDFGESPIDAAVREVKEETGLRIKEVQFTGKVSNDWFPEQGKHFINLFYVAVAENPEDLHVPEKEKDKFDEWVWFNPHYLPGGVWMHTASVIGAMFDPRLKLNLKLPGVG